MVEFWKISKRRRGQHGEIVSGRHVLWMGPAAGIDEPGIRHAKFERGAVHLGSECVLAAGQSLGDNDRGIIARLHDNAAKQVFDPHPRTDVDVHFRTAFSPRLFADAEGVLQGQTSRLQAFEQKVDGHHLGHRRGRHAGIAVLFKKHGASIEIAEIDLLGATFEELSIRRSCSNQPTCEEPTDQENAPYNRDCRGCHAGSHARPVHAVATLPDIGAGLCREFDRLVDDQPGFRISCLDHSRKHVVRILHGCNGSEANPEQRPAGNPDLSNLHAAN